MPPIYSVIAGIVTLASEVFLYIGISQSLLLFIRLAAKLEPPPKHGDQFQQMEAEAKSIASAFALAFGLITLLFLALITLK